MKKEETVDYHIKACWHSIARMYNQKAMQEDITTSIGFVLININSSEGTPATKIAPMMGLESRSLTRMLKTMEEKGLIVKKPDLQDKRSVRVFLTEEGKRKKAISVETIKQFNKQVRDKLSQDEFKAFFVIFEKINQVVNHVHEQIDKPQNQL
ncbi:MarR family winged helix-turn-helix transcriptional regulator [Negadavirga shengliensis]|uniref:MarR family winged helix-turn-helix transcriptional regulator n=1 Tax=Negadavirga shengliensis TaxID=1389218 RepID=A0ABV9SW48_9BACT